VRFVGLRCGVAAIVILSATWFFQAITTVFFLNPF
jgi:hypothetical protein